MHQHLQDGVDDGWAAGAAQNRKESSITQDDSWGHGRERSFARLYLIGVPLVSHLANVRRTWFRGEIVHFVVEQHSGAASGHAAAVAAVQRVGHRDCVALSVNDGIMSGLSAFVRWRDSG